MNKNKCAGCKHEGNNGAMYPCCYCKNNYKSNYEVNLEDSATMTNEEAIALLRKYKPVDQGWCSGDIELSCNYGGMAVETAIKALESIDIALDFCKNYKRLEHERDCLVVQLQKIERAKEKGKE